MKKTIHGLYDVILFIYEINIIFINTGEIEMELCQLLLQPLKFCLKTCDFIEI